MNIKGKPQKSKCRSMMGMQRTSCAMVMPHSRLKFSSSEGLGASWVLRGNLSPLSELDLLLRLNLLSSPDLSSSSGVPCLARFGDTVLRKSLLEGILMPTLRETPRGPSHSVTPVLGAAQPDLCFGMVRSNKAVVTSAQSNSQATVCAPLWSNHRWYGKNIVKMAEISAFLGPNNSLTTPKIYARAYSLRRQVRGEVSMQRWSAIEVENV